MASTRPIGPDDDPTGVRDLLASLPDPGPMPEDLVARISAALDAEQGRRVAPGTVPPPEGSTLATVVPLGPERRRRRLLAPTLLGAAAAVAGIAIVTPAVLDGLHGDATYSSASLHSGASTAVATSTAPRPSAADAATGTGGQVGIAAATPGEPAVQVRLAPPLRTTDLGAHGSSLLAERWTPATPHTVEQPGVGPIGTPRGVQECLAGLDAPDARRVAAEITTYADRPAVVIAQQDRQGRTQRVYVAALPCTQVRAERLADPVVTPR